MRILPATALGALLYLSGCAFEAKDIDTWPGVSGGVARLAGYMADAKRPTNLRVQAAQRLFEKPDLAALMGVVRVAKVDQRAILLPAVLKFAADNLTNADAKISAKAAGLAFYVLEFNGELGDSGGALASALADWALPLLGTQAPGLVVEPENALLAAAMVHQEPVLAKVFTVMATAPEARLLALVRLTDRIQTESVKQKNAELLLAHARKVSPKISRALVTAMLANANETLMRYLLELNRDPRVPRAVRDTGMQMGSRLGKKVLPGYMRIIATDFPTADDARYLALRGVWEYGGPTFLAAALNALPADGVWPEEGNHFKHDIDAFCDNRLATKKEAVRPVLTALLDSDNWVAQAYAMECIIQLYPDDAKELLQPLANNLTALAGWSQDGEPSSFAAVVKAL